MNKKMMDNQQLTNEQHLRFAVLSDDVLLFTIKDNELYVRLIDVNRPPFFPEGSKGFPGGLIRPDETAEDAAIRLIKDKAKILSKHIYIEQLHIFSGIHRDPRGRVVAVAYLALIPWQDLSEAERQNQPDTWWQKVSDIKDLAYDHNEMLEVALLRLRSQLKNTTIISKLLPSEFTLGELERAYTTVLNQPVDKRNFRKKIAKLGILEELARKQTGLANRPAKLYKFKSSRVKEIEIM